MDKSQQEKRLLEDQIQALKESITVETKERQELETRLRNLTEDPEFRSKEIEDVFSRNYSSKLEQYERMVAKMNILKDKLDASKSFRSCFDWYLFIYLSV